VGSTSRAVVVHSAQVQPTPTRRAGLMERRLVTPSDSVLQSVVLIDAEVGAVVELHPVPNSETLFIIRGLFAVATPDEQYELGPGSSVYFPPGASHSLACLSGPGQYLVVFAPSRAS
jgi:quercetin dioxygenase-like cupin family protein